MVVGQRVLCQLFSVSIVLSFIKSSCVCVCVYQGMCISRSRFFGWVQDPSVGFKIINIKSIEFQGFYLSMPILKGKSSNPSANCSRLRPPLFYRLRPPPPHLMMGLILSMCILLDHWPFLITACSVWNWKVSAICANGKWQNSRDEAMFLISLLYVPVFAPLRNPRVLLFSYVYVQLIIITSPGTNILFAFSRGRNTGIAAPTSTSQDHQQETT